MFVMFWYFFVVRLCHLFVSPILFSDIFCFGRLVPVDWLTPHSLLVKSPFPNPDHTKSLRFRRYSIHLAISHWGSQQPCAFQTQAHGLQFPAGAVEHHHIIGYPKHIPKHHWKIITWHYWITLVGCWFLPSFRFFGQRYRLRGMIPKISAQVSLV